MPMSSSKRTPFQDITNGQNKDPKEAERQRKREYYAKNKDEIAKRRRQARELKKQTTTPLIEDNTICHTPATGQSGVTQLQHITPAEGASTLQSDDRAPVKDQTNNNGLFQDTTNEQKIDSREAERLKKIEWYAKNKEEVAKRRRQARELKKQATTVQIDHQSQVIQEPCIGGIGSSYSGMAKDLTTPCSESVIFDEDHGDWLHSNLTYMGDVRSVKNLQNISTSAWLNGQESFAEICADSEKKRQHESSQQKRQRERERYSSMTDAQKDVWLQNNREHKKLARAHKSPFINSPCTPVMQTQPSRNNGTDLGDTNSDDDLDTADIFEPGEQGTIFEDNLDTIQEELSIHDDDEECRIFSGTGDVFDSFRVTSGVASSNQNDDPYDFVYHNLPTKHHVLKPVKDCAYCGAMRLQYEGHAFCCRKGKVKIVTPEVPEELRRLFTSQVDDDAKYFRKHI